MNVIHFQVCFQCIAEEGKPPWWGIWKNGTNERFVLLGYRLLGGAPRGRGNGTEHLKPRKTLFGGSEHV